MKKRNIPIILFAAFQEQESEEMKALALIKEQVKTFNEKLEGTIDKDTFDKLNAKIEELEKELKTGEDIKDIDARITKINLENERLHNAVKQLELDKLKEEAKEGGVDRSKQRAQFEKALREFSKSIAEGRVFKENGKPLELVIPKEVDEFTYPNTFEDGSEVSAFTGREIDPVLYSRRRKTNIILDYFDIRTINVPELIYLRKVDVDPDEEIDYGGAAWIACGSSKPPRRFTLDTGVAKAKKVAIFNTIDDCLLEDVPSFLNWVRDDFNQEMDEAINSGLLNGGDSNTPLGLKENAVTFVPTPAFDETIADPNEIDAIFAMAATMAENRETPAIVFVAKGVYYKIMALKDNNGRYQNNSLVYVNNLGELYIGGIRVVPVDSEDVDYNNALMIGADPGFKIRAYGGRTIETGLNKDDFEKDKTSIRGYQRFLSYIPEDRENSVMYDTWDNILSAIEKPAEETGGVEG